MQFFLIHTAWPIRADDFSSMVIGRIAPAGHTSEQRVHSGRQYPRSYDISGCISLAGSVEGRSTLLGQADTQSWQAVQCRAKWRALHAPGGTIGVARTGIFLSSMTASPPSTFFSCAFTTDVAASTAVAERKLRRAVSICSEVTVCAGLSVAVLFVFFQRYYNRSASCLQVSIQSMHATQRL